MKEVAGGVLKDLGKNNYSLRDAPGHVVAF